MPRLNFTNAASSSGSDSSPKRSCFLYFFNVHTKPLSAQQFKRHWASLPSHQFDAIELSTVLTRTVKALRKGDPQEAQAIKDFLRGNMSCWEEKAIARLNEFDAQGLDNALWSFATLGQAPSEKFMRAWEKTAHKKIDTFDLQALNISFWALAKLGAIPSEDFLSDWEKQSIREFSNVNRKTIVDNSGHAQNLSNGLWGFATLKIQPSQEYLDAWEKIASSGQIQFRPQNIANILWSHAVLGIKPSEKLTESLESSIESELARFTPQERWNSLWSMAVISVLRADPKASATTLKMHQSMDGIRTDQKGLTQMLQAELRFDWPVSAYAYNEQNTRSDSEVKLASAFNRAASGVQANTMVPGMHHKVDIAVMNKTRKILIEVDGFDHFIAGRDGNPDRYHGGTYLQSALIRKLEPDAVLIRLRHHEGNLMLDSGQDMTDAARRILDRARELGPGAYESFTKEDGSIGLRSHLPKKPQKAVPAADGQPAISIR